MLNYGSIKEMAKENKCKVTDLIVLASQNDPFYVGGDAQSRDAEWIAKLYNELLGSPANVHIRRIHYALVSRGNIIKPDGNVYENTDHDWKYLENACKYARYLDLIPIENFVDRRNPDAEINAKYWENDDSILDDFSFRDAIDSIINKVCPYNSQLTQAYHLELWCEKSTMNDVLMPLGDAYNANVVTGLGELSITAVVDMINRVKRANREARIFYISDFDPAGENMPVSVARKVEYFCRKYNNLPNIKLNPIILTKEQCQKYKLPRTPIKDTDKRKAGFENKHGEGATELDALEALHPGQMKKIISKALEPYFDIDAYNKVCSENQRIRDALKGKISDGIQELFNGLALDDINDDFDFPIGKLLEFESDGFLLDTDKRYLDQLSVYKRRKSA